MNGNHVRKDLEILEGATYKVVSMVPQMLKSINKQRTKLWHFTQHLYFIILFPTWRKDEFEYYMDQ